MIINPIIKINSKAVKVISILKIANAKVILAITMPFCLNCG
jgi:hypothetical protein